MNKKKIYFIVCVTAFLAVFAALITVASLYDLQISRFMTKGSLGKGEYYSSNQFALFFEVMGDSVVYIAGGTAAVIIANFALKMCEGERFLFVRSLKGLAYKIVKWVFAIGFSAFAAYEFYETCHNVFKYTDRYLYAATDGTAFSLDSPHLVAVQVVFALAIFALVFALIAKINSQNIKKLVKVAIIILFVEAMYLLLVGLIKTPVGRMRYRAMNAIDDFSYYTAWYKLNGARHVGADGSIIKSYADESELLLGVTDTCKSFPSGHTYCAAMSFALICLPDLFESFSKKWVKVICRTVPAAYTITVAVCRIVVGAHFLSDVLIGGTLSFTLTVIAREVVVLKCSHFKAFGTKRREDTQQEETQPLNLSE